jgi:hypothetical protein
MPNAPEDTKPESWHRFFAMTGNNAAWALAERPGSGVDVRKLLDAAHAAAWHWEAVGNELNRMRALLLLAQAHAMAGLGTTALTYADEMRTYFLATPSTPDWEVAFVHAIHAHAASAAGSVQLHTRSYAEAERAAAAIADPEDRRIFDNVFRHVPPP